MRNRNLMVSICDSWRQAVTRAQAQTTDECRICGEPICLHDTGLIFERDSFPFTVAHESCARREHFQAQDLEIENQRRERRERQA